MAGFPASFLIGPMLVAMVFAVKGARLSVARPGLLCAQAIVGCLVARALDPSILDTIAEDWAAILLVVMTTVVASTFAGWLIARTHLLPGTTAAWGCSPGAATGMVAMSEEFGADPRLVAFMQFLRVTLVVITATLVPRLVFGVTAADHAAADVQNFADQLPDLAATLALAAGGGLAARLLPIPSGGVFVPLIIAAVLQGTGLITITLPPWLLVIAFGAIGLWVGLRFERETVLYALRAMPVMLVGIISLILLCGVSAVMLVWLVDTDPLTAFLATVPGGVDAIAIIAVDTNADISFVLALQTVRLFVVIVTGPMLAKLICRLV
jgi:membrane AbrB-like protein